MLSVSTNDRSAIAPFVDEYERRVRATPPGMCPVVLQLSLLRASGCQTCGKCVPCREGLPQLERMVEQVVAFNATPEILPAMRALAQNVRETADCAIGWHAAEVFLQGMDAFADEFKRHVNEGRCDAGVVQSVPCETDCPAHVNVPAYVQMVGEGDYAGAVAMVRKDNPFPTACGYVCEHPCESRCRRTLIDAPINIRGLKKMACDQVEASAVPTPAPAPATGKRVAVVGAGPSGLTAAYFLALMGHHVDVFESRKRLGGMMRYGIPAYRFPREKLDQDIRAILSAGDISVHAETPVDAAKMEELSAGHDAVYVAIGAQGGKMLDLPGADAEGVMSAVDLLTRIGDGDYPDFTGKRVVVIGGGNVAMDCARTSVRAGAASVQVAYRRRIDDMTALRTEIDSAMQEGVEILMLQSPDHIEVDETGRCTALITQPQFIGAVKRGRPAPQKASKPPLRIPADVILVAVGQAIESAPFEEAGMEADRTRFTATPQLKAAGSLPNVFVGGDCQLGPKTVILAVGAGKVAARNIDEFLGFHHELDCGVGAPAPHPNKRTPCGRVEVHERLPHERRCDFEGVEVEMSVEEAQQEASRCLRCDHYGCGAMEGGRVQYV